MFLVVGPQQITGAGVITATHLQPGSVRIGLIADTISKTELSLTRSCRRRTASIV